mmetsp:Transcript_44723/g.87695  ORF Transcript_44723/g.87695 Transcript_44723/m.87695 type:complete len:208 (-) Transcript_44723:137-760(-)
MRSWKAIAKLYSPASMALATRLLAPSLPIMTSNFCSLAVPADLPSWNSAYLMVYCDSGLVLWSRGISTAVTRPLTMVAPYPIARSRMYRSRTSRRHIPMYSSGFRVSPMSTSTPVGLISFILRTFLSTTVSGKSNSPTIHSGIAPPHGLALSSLRSNSTVSTFFSWAKISAAQAPEGPPPTTATRYFISRADRLRVAARAECRTLEP